MVYIDNFNAKFGRMIMCHMMADTKQELLEMADKIGIQRKWIQCPDTDREHFDVCLSAKKKAIEAGAIEVGFRELAMMSIGKYGITPMQRISKYADTTIANKQSNLF